MKKRLKGLLGIWLSVVMLITTLAAPISVNAASSPSATIAVNYRHDFPQAGAISNYSDISVTSGATLDDAIALSDGCEIKEWQIWECEYGVDGGSEYFRYVDKTACNSAGWVLTDDDIARLRSSEFSNTSSGAKAYVAVPIIETTVKIYTGYYNSLSDGDIITGSDCQNISVILNMPFDSSEQPEMPKFIQNLPDNVYINYYDIYRADSAALADSAAVYIEEYARPSLTLGVYGAIKAKTGGSTTPLIVPEYGIAEVYVGGVKLDFDTYYKNNDKSVSSDASTSENYNAYLDKINDEYVLTIKNLDVEGKDGNFTCWTYISSGLYVYPESAGIASNVDLTIDVQGDNKVKGVENTASSDGNVEYQTAAGVATTATLTLTGSGKLTAETTSVLQPYGNTSGIVAADIVAKGPQIAAAGGEANRFVYGVYAINSLTVTDGIFESECMSDASSYAICCYNVNFSDAIQTNSNWYKWKTSKDGDWSISSDGYQYSPANYGTKNYVFIAPVSYTESAPDTDLELPGDIIIIPPNSPSGGGGATKYSVKFESNGGTEIKTQYLTKAAKLTKPDDPEKDGYTFGGWYTDEELTKEYDFTSRISKNITLYAKWNETAQAPEVGDDTTPERKNPFADVDKGDWFYDAVEFMYQNGYMTGTSDDRFDPDMSITRAMFVTILYRIENKPDISMSALFKDVSSGSYYEDAVAWAYSTGIVNGVTDTEFAPDLIITREQMATMMYRYANYKKYDTSVGENTNILSYDDFDKISEYAIPAMQYAVGAGIIQGENVSTLNPSGLATRAATAVIIHRFIKLYN